MIKKIIKEFTQLLPLSVEKIEWNDPSLILIGNNWNFATITSWRIINANELICGCYDKNAGDEIQKLKQFKIISIDIQSNHLSIDPIFEFSDEYKNRCKLEIFSTTFLEPWIFDFSSDVVYVSSP